MTTAKRALAQAEAFLLPQPDCGGVKARRALRAALALAFSCAIAASLAKALWPAEIWKAVQLCGILWFLLLRMDLDAPLKRSSALMGAVAAASASGLALSSLGTELPSLRLPLLLLSAAACFLARANWKPCAPAATSFLVAFLFGPMMLAQGSLLQICAGILAALAGFLLAASALPRKKPSELAARHARSSLEEAARHLDSILISLKEARLEKPQNVAMPLARSAVESLSLELPAGPERERLGDLAASMLRLERSLAMASSAAEAMLSRPDGFNPKAIGKALNALSCAAEALRSGSTASSEKLQTALAEAREELLSGPLRQPGRPFLMCASLYESLERAEANASAARSCAEGLAK